MFRIDIPYVNECLSRALADGHHSIHLNDTQALFSYFAKHYNYNAGESHLVTNAGDIFEIKTSLDNRYVTLIAE